ncbi:terpenoid synthase [Schizopora paradoxa]|uniref:Terpene synthase n=1 Tax=Schizopora paradoxa TaxID=27342 RepID=A0A0H2R937_9AGAM|nr:terpenoid synthase [Schizopora paradoxa]
MHDYELLAALTYSYAGPEELRTTCDLINLLFVIDEISDKLDGEKARELGDNVLKVLGGEYIEGFVLSKMVEDFRLRFIKKAAPKCQERFLASWATYLSAVSQEADLRVKGDILGIEPYIDIRRENSAARVCFGLFEYVHGIDLPDEVYNHPIFQAIYWGGVDLVGILNDLYSYSVERSRGLESNNFLTVVMKEKGLTVQQAADFTGKVIMDRVIEFQENEELLPSFGEELDEAAHKYIFSVSQWYIGSLIWSFETTRYFGAKNQDVKKNLVVDVQEFNHEEEMA